MKGESSNVLDFCLSGLQARVLLKVLHVFNIYNGAVLGFCQSSALFRALSGWNDSFWGYHGDEGDLFHAVARSGRRYAEVFEIKDVVGCCIMRGRANGVFHQEQETTIYITILSFLLFPMKKPICSFSKRKSNPSSAPFSLA